MKKEEEEYAGEPTKLIQFFERVLISRHGKPYLKRLIIFGIRKIFDIKYHEILQSDGLCGHDHPWGFITIILRGGYYEWTPKSQKEKGHIVDERIAIDGSYEVMRWHGPGSIMYRPAKWRHLLELPVDENGNEMPAKSLVFAGPEIKDWYFFTKVGKIFWKDYEEKRDC